MAVLLSLGTWQLKRLSWKENLIATIEARLKSPPISMSEALALPPAEADYRQIRTEGRFLSRKPQKLYHVFKGILGWKLLYPFQLNDGTVFWVDMGFEPDDAKDAWRPPEAMTPLMAALRTTYGRAGWFTPDNEPDRSVWYWFDQPALDAVSKLPKSREGIVLQADKAPLPTTWTGANARLKPHLSNKHFGYAMTWFGLAITLLGVYIAYILQHRRKTSSS